MDEYIKRKDVLKAGLKDNRFAFRLDDPINEEVVFGTIYKDFVEVINRIPAADVVEVVRCKDCKSGVTEFGKRYCKEPFGMFGVIPTSDDNFCSYGERK